MGSPQIKHTPASSIDEQFKNLDLVVNIEKHLAASKNLSWDLKKLSSSDRGLYCEYLVYQKLLKEKFKFIAHRFKTPMAEIDLLFIDGSRAVAVEVKSNTSEAFLFTRVGRRQKTKLHAARLFLESQYPEAQLLLAVVSHDASIELFENF